MKTFTCVNDTDQPLQFYAQTEVMPLLKGYLVPPHSSSKPANVIKDGHGIRVLARRPDNTLVFDRTFTWAELEEENSRVVVSSLEPVPQAK